MDITIFLFFSEDPIIFHASDTMPDYNLYDNDSYGIVTR